MELALVTLPSILRQLGGDKSVADALQCGAPAISNWKMRGIPKGRWVDLVALAGRKGVVLTIADVEAANAAIVQSQTSETTQPQAAE